MSTPQQLVAKLWNYCNVLRDDGLSYGDYVEQLTFLLFLKMVDEGTKAPFNRPSTVPGGYGWPELLARSGDDLEVQYRHTLEELGKRGGMLGLIFRKAQNKIQNPARLEKLIRDLIDRESWLSMSADVKGGAGQYFTPRPLIKAIVQCVDPHPGETICDPACGTGGFLLAAYEHLATDFELDRDQKRALQNGTLFGVELVDSVSRLCAMNLLLHGIGGSTGSQPVTQELPIQTRDALAAKHGEYDIVLTKPPFGKKSSVTVVGEDGEVGRDALTIEREDFWATTSNKQLNFLQHVFSILKEHGRAAVVVPDNVLFEGGKANLDIFWLKDESLEDSANLPSPDVLAAGIVEDLEAALAQFALIAGDLGSARAADRS